MDDSDGVRADRNDVTEADESPGAAMHALARRLFRAVERALCDSPLKRVAGFYVAAYEKRV